MRSGVTSIGPCSAAILAAVFAVAVAAGVVVTLIRDSGPRDPPPRLTWAPPQLEAPTTIAVGGDRRTLTLERSRDYIIEMPPRPLIAAGGVRVTGGRNVVLIGGEIVVPQLGRDPEDAERRGLMLKGQTGVVHIEGLLIGGDDLSDGIVLDERSGATVQIQNVRVERVTARDTRNFSDFHPDVLQTWAGPAELRIDRLSGSTDYQGLFLDPLDFHDATPRRFDVRRVDLRGSAKSRYLLWLSGRVPLSVQQVHVAPAPGRPLEQTVWPDVRSWTGVHLGTPPGGEFVPESSVGASYRSPGYADG